MPLCLPARHRSCGVFGIRSGLYKNKNKQHTPFQNPLFIQKPDIVRVVRGRGDPCVDETQSWFLLHKAQLELANKSKPRSLHLEL